MIYGHGLGLLLFPRRTDKVSGFSSSNDGAHTPTPPLPPPSFSRAIPLSSTLSMWRECLSSRASRVKPAPSGVIPRQRRPPGDSDYRPLCLCSVWTSTGQPPSITCQRSCCFSLTHILNIFLPPLGLRTRPQPDKGECVVFYGTRTKAKRKKKKKEGRGKRRSSVNISGDAAVIASWAFQWLCFE